MTLRLSSILLLLVWAVPSLAADPSAQEAARQAWQAAQQALVRGPATISLRDQAKLALPEGYGFVPQAQSAALMRAMGNRPGDTLVGLVFPLQKGHDWFVSANYQPSGYIKDDDALHWDSDKLLQQLKEGTESANADRERLGIPAITVTRWIEPPAYERQSHRLVWSAEAKAKNASNADPTVNYNTYVLGREGYISLNLITQASTVDQDKASARTLIAATSFDSGKRYTDFNSSTDKVAAYGLAALVAGVAAKKLGLLALLAAGMVKFAKVIILAVAGLGAALRKWFKSRTKPEAPLS